MRLHPLLISAILLAGGIPAGVVAWKVGAPIPFLAAPLLLSAVVAIGAQSAWPEGYIFLPRVRIMVMAIIGVAIGRQVTPELLRQLPDFMWSMIAMTAFVPLVHVMNYHVMRRVGGMSRTDAFFSASPGGFVESLLMTERYGGTVRIVTMQHFLRIIAVIVLIPLILSLYLGIPVGRVSASTDMFPPLDPAAVLLIPVYAVSGFLLARKIRLPAGHLIGPLLITAMLSSTGLLPEFTVPPSLIAGAQIIVGLSLGSRFAGLRGSEIRRSAVSSAICISGMLAIAFALSETIHLFTGIPLEILFLTFAPGGVTEMGLIALSLSGNPAVVVMHHVYRIIITVLMMTGFLKKTGFLTEKR